MKKAKKMKKTLITIALGLTLTACAELQSFVKELPSQSNSQSNTTQSTQSQDDFSTLLSDKEFSERMIKQIYPSATYNYEEKRYEIALINPDFGEEYVSDSKYPIETALKDVNTSQDKLRYFYSTAYGPEYKETKFFVFKEMGNTWKLIDKTEMGGSSKGEGPMIKIDKIGNDKFGFLMRDSSYCSVGVCDSSEDLVYLADNKLNTVSLCSSSVGGAGSMKYDCESKIRQDLKPTDDFYPIALNYTVTKYKVDSDNWATEQVLATRKGKVLVEFNTEKKQYERPKAFDKIESEDMLWNYFK